MRTTFLCALIATVTIALTNSEVEAHSWADCVDWRSTNDGKPNMFAAKGGTCHGWARRYPIKPKFPFGLMDKDSRHYNQGALSKHNPACSNTKQGDEKGQDETRPSAKNPAYGGKWQQQARAAPGQRMCVRWPAKNHAKEDGVKKVDINLQLVPTTSDPSQTDLLDAKKTFITHIPYEALCTPNKVGDTTPCGGCWTVPKDLKAGTYFVQWRWLLNTSEFYTSCWDLIVEKGSNSTGKH